MEINSEAIYYLNKIVGLAKEMNRLEEECEEKTGIHICANSAHFDFLNKQIVIQTSNSIDKLGLPVNREDEKYKFVELNGYQVIEV